MTATIEQRNPTPEHHIVSREEWIMGRKQLLAKEKESTRRIRGRKQDLLAEDSVASDTRVNDGRVQLCDQ
jgi:hypothetical protein